MSNRLILRALNEAHRSDPVAYLALRFVTNTTVGMKDHWVRTVTPSLLKERAEAVCTKTKQFKEIDANGKVKFRNVFSSDGVQQLAEIALIEQCALAKGPFEPSSSVYSYRFETRFSSNGAFLPYFDLFKKRQQTISKRCVQYSKHQVVHLDIEKFYPSITKGRLLAKWRAACKESELGDSWVELGIHLIDLQFQHGEGLWIGSLFSHLLANLYLRELDEELEKLYPNRYFRYVDDFVILVRPKDRTAMIQDLKKRLKSLGLKLNSKKTIYFDAGKWRDSAPFQNERESKQKAADEDWMLLIDKIRRFLLSQPEEAPKLREAFIKNEIRIPIARHEAAIKSPHYITRFKQRLNIINGILPDSHGLSVPQLCTISVNLRDKYLADFTNALEQYQEATPLLKNWKRSRLRFLLSRCLMICSEPQLRGILSAIEELPDFQNYRAILVAITQCDASSLISLGWKPTFAAASILSSKGSVMICNPPRWSQAVVEAYSVLLLFGIKTTSTIPNHVATKPRIKFAEGRNSSANWTKIKDPFYRSLLCLVNDTTVDELVEALQTPLDPDENFELFTTELMELRSP